MEIFEHSLYFLLVKLKKEIRRLDYDIYGWVLLPDVRSTLVFDMIYALATF